MTRMMIFSVVCGAFLSVIFLTAGVAAPQVDPQKCLESTTTHSLNSKSILDGLDLTRDQKIELRVRLSSYNSVRGFQGLDGLDLTPDQVVVIQRRIDVQVAAMHAHPIGWPCAAFLHPKSVMSFVRKTLIYNGFRPAMTLKLMSPRQVQFFGIQDGIRIWGTVAKTGPRQLTFRLTTASGDPGSGTYRLATAFDA